jgi:hypothetical protein
MRYSSVKIMGDQLIIKDCDRIIPPKDGGETSVALKDIKTIEFRGIDIFSTIWAYSLLGNIQIILNSSDKIKLSIPYLTDYKVLKKQL